MEIDNPIESATKGAIGALFWPIIKWRRDSRKIKRLREMLTDTRFPQGFRSIEQLSGGIGETSDETIELLFKIGARKSETSEQWSLK